MVPGSVSPRVIMEFNLNCILVFCFMDYIPYLSTLLWYYLQTDIAIFLFFSFLTLVLCGTMQAHAPPPGYFVRLENASADDDLYLRKKARMRRWLCCSCHVDESYPSHESEHLKSPGSYADGIFSYLPIFFYLACKWKKIKIRSSCDTISKCFYLVKIMVIVVYL